MQKAVKIYAGITFFFVLHLCVYGFTEISFRGYWADRVPFWIWFISTIWFIQLSWKKFAVKVYAGVLAFFLVLSLIPFGMPFIIIMQAVSGMDVDLSKNLPDNYRLQVYGRGLMGVPNVEIIKMYGPFEKAAYFQRLPGLSLPEPHYGYAPLGKMESFRVKGFTSDSVLLAMRFRDTVMDFSFNKVK